MSSLSKVYPGDNARAEKDRSEKTPLNCFRSELTTPHKLIMYCLSILVNVFYFSLGYVPHCDMMQFIAMASSGAYLANTPPVSKDCCYVTQAYTRHTKVSRLTCRSVLHGTERCQTLLRMTYSCTCRNPKLRLV